MAHYHEVYNCVIEKLRATNQLDNILTYFQRSKDNIAKVQIVDQLKQNGHFPPHNILMTTHKSNKESTNYRILGNKHFAAKTNSDYLIALKLYNKSICYAQSNSEELSIGFANRSAVYFALELYDDCLENIKLAKELPYPTRLMEKLNDREGNCLKLRRPDKKVELPRPKLSFPGSYKTPLALVADCLKLEKNEQYGRHVITTIDLKAGDVVAIEESFCSTLPSSYQFERCQNCLNEHNYNLIPCKHCTSAMFCGKTCYDEAYEKFHKIECPIIGYMEKMFCEDSTATLRTVVCAVTTFGSVDELVTFFQESKGRELTTVFDCNFNNKSKNSYGPVNGLAERDYDVVGEFVSCILASLMYQPILEHTEFKKMFTTPKAISTFKELTFHSIKTLSINRSKSILLDGNLLKNFAGGVHPFRSMHSHSCANNMMITSYDKTMVYTAVRPIKAGEQLFDNYE